MTHAPKALQTITAANPSPLTGPGTNSFLLGRDQIAVIDPGPDLPAHRAAILAAAAGGRITHILVTHAHLDHSQGAHALAQATGAPIFGFGPAEAGRSQIMQRLAQDGALAGGEGIDRDFTPDILLGDGERLETPEWSLTALHTPGHFAGHLSFQWQDEIFCGDVVMGWSSTLISPPDGDLAEYYRALARLDAAGAARLRPAHGDPIDNPAARIAELLAHRQLRTRQILQALADGPANAAELAARIYDIPPALQPAATRNVLAHLIALTEEGQLRPENALTHDARFHLNR
ncbi:MBL fold metallo-hydrolase [Paracoccus litorisediminis]|uniref:MBL fold metallo-hydrolase n=1 Tax=Paracoccus litorisediminis TaxID=2006130 RepID=A0A844HN25_9RHOB|nr:MBL fold metallo-hydrolase [Paracoccus litorisediminis]MTH59565.1 MBL fold metallo-hydrolase [Paracoccus litorisediminis]